MFNARTGLILGGLAYAIWETVDIFWISFPAAAAVFAALFFICTAWFWRNNSARAALALLVLMAFEGAVAPTLRAMPVTKIADVALAIVGITCAIAVLVAARHERSSSRGLAELG
jgi:hypothetical protein